MNPALMLLLALGVLVLPPGAGLLLAPAARLAGVDRTTCTGLLLLGLARCADVARASVRQEGDVPAGVRLAGRWRDPPGGRPHLETTAGPVLVRWSADAEPPTPGSAITVLARLGAESLPRVVAVERQEPPAGAWLDRWAAAAGRRLETLVSPTQRGLVAALVLGRRHDLPLPVVRDAIATGTMHVFALSGLHVALVALLLQRFVGVLATRTTVWQGLLLLVFVCLAGSRPPLRRAFLGWFALSAGRRLARCGDGLHRLGAVALVLLVWDPSLVSSLSAQMSFLAVGGFITGGRLGCRVTARAGVGALRSLAWLAAPAGAFLTTAPLCGTTFGLLQPWGVVVTPLVLPTVSLVLLVGLIAIVPGSLLAGLDVLTAPLLEWSAGLLQWSLATLARACPAPWHPEPLGAPLPASCMVLAALLSLSQALAPGRDAPNDGAPDDDAPDDRASSDDDPDHQDGRAGDGAHDTVRARTRTSPWSANPWEQRLP